MSSTSLSSMTSTTMLEVCERGVKRWIKVDVTEPVTITAKENIAWTSSFTTYLIRLETNHYAFSLPCSEIRRRYSEFCWLRAKLASHHPNKVVPPIPSKRYLHVTKFDPKVIEERRAGLAKFLQRVMRSSVFLSDAALHLFLQSELSTRTIDSKMTEELPVRSASSPCLVQTLRRAHLARSISYGSQSAASDAGGSTEGTANSSELETSSEDDPIEF